MPRVSPGPGWCQAELRPQLEGLSLAVRPRSAACPGGPSPLNFSIIPHPRRRSLQGEPHGGEGAYPTRDTGAQASSERTLHGDGMVPSSSGTPGGTRCLFGTATTLGQHGAHRPWHTAGDGAAPTPAARAASPHQHQGRASPHRRYPKAARRKGLPHPSQRRGFCS